MRVSIQDALATRDCEVPACPREAERNGRCRSHNRIQDDLNSSFWMSDRKETPDVPMKRHPVDPSSEFFQECLEQIRAFHRLVGRWPVPSDAVEFSDLPPKSNAMPWEGGWQPLWDAVGAGQLPQGRAVAAYRAGLRVEQVVLAPSDEVAEQEVVVEAAVSPHQDDYPPDDPDAPFDPAAAAEAAREAESDAYRTRPETDPHPDDPPHDVEAGIAEYEARLDMTDLLRIEDMSSWADLTRAVERRQREHEAARAAYDEAVRELFKHPVYRAAALRFVDITGIGIYDGEDVSDRAIVLETANDQ